MGNKSPIKIEYFTDVLCVWAYGGQVRVDQLMKDFSGQIELRYRFCPLFAATHHRISEGWKDQGGFEGFSRHVCEVSEDWAHTIISPKVWSETRPASSTGVHAFLKAIELMQSTGQLSPEPVAEFEGRSLFEEALWRIRKAFFLEARNIADKKVQIEVAKSLGIATNDVFALIDNGEAYAALHIDNELNEKYRVPGSPTFVLNEGRQLLYGNLGYRIVEANVRELLREPDCGDANWC